MRLALPRSATGLPATYWWLFAGTAASSLATFVFPFLALYLGSRGWPASRVGLVVALFGLGSVPASPLGGWLADRVGRRRTIVVSLVCAGLLTLALPALESAAALAVCTLALGVAAHAYHPASSAIVADVVPAARTTDAFGLLYWLRNLGIAVSFAGGGLLASAGYAPLFLVDGATTLVFAALLAWKVPETRPSVAHRPALAGFAAALRDPRFARLLLLNVVFATAFLQFVAGLPLVMAAQGLSTQAYGGVMAVNGVTIALLQPLLARRAATHPPSDVLAVAAGLVAAGYVAYAHCSTPLAYAGATFVWSVGEILTIPVTSALAARLAPQDLRGSYQGLLGLTFGVGLAAAPALGGMVLAGPGATALWYGTAAAALGVAAAHVITGRAAPHAAPHP
jgi:predicted MFS family arabinose efflux permease